MAARLAKRPKLICHEHTEVRNYSCLTDYRLWLRVLFAKRADLIVGVSQSITQGIKKLYKLAPERFATVFNGADLEAVDGASPINLKGKLGLPHTCSVIGFGGRIAKEKGLTYLLEAIPAVLSEHPNRHFVIIGDGPLRTDLANQAADLAVADHVTFLGPRSDMYGLLKGLDLYVQPSLWEGLPMVVMEAMAASKPVVATSVGGTAEVVIDGETGLLVPPKNPEALANAISDMLGNPDRARAMGVAGRNRVAEHFTFQAAARKIENIYYELLSLN